MSVASCSVAVDSWKFKAEQFLFSPPTAQLESYSVFSGQNIKELSRFSGKCNRGVNCLSLFLSTTEFYQVLTLFIVQLLCTFRVAMFL